MSCHLINGITSLENDVIDLTHSVSPAHDRLVYLLLLSSWLIHVPMTMRLCNSRLPEEHFVCYQTSQRKWVIIKVLYRCLQRYLLGWRISRLGFVTPIVGEVSLGPLGNAHHISLATIATNELVVRWCITERVKRLAGNEIELGIEIPTIESRASNIPMTKGTTYVVMRSDR